MRRGVRFTRVMLMKNTDKPVPGSPSIEILPEMMRAGRDAWLSYGGEFEDAEDAVRDIWDNMVTAMFRQMLADDEHDLVALFDK